MRKYAMTLTGSLYDHKCGNHRVHFVSDEVREFIYSDTAICVVDDKREVFYTDNGGYNTSSTNTAIGQYRTYFTMRGYKEVGKNEF